MYWETWKVREYLTSGWSNIWVHPNRLSPDQELIWSTWPNFQSLGNARTIISLIRLPWPNSPYFHAGLFQWKDMGLPWSPYHWGSGRSPLVVSDQIYVGHVDLHRPVNLCRSRVPFPTFKVTGYDYAYKLWNFLCLPASLDPLEVSVKWEEQIWYLNIKSIELK